MKKPVQYLALGVLCCMALLIFLYVLQWDHPDKPSPAALPLETVSGKGPVIDLPTISQSLVANAATAPPARGDETGVTLLPGTRKTQAGAGAGKTRGTGTSSGALETTDLSPIMWDHVLWKGDLDGMRKRREIRALVPFSRTFFFLDRGRRRGLIYELLKEYEKFLHHKGSQRHLGIHITIIPTPRNRLLRDLVAGYGDIAAGNLTITPDREKQVDFSDPLLTNVAEIIVSGPGSPRINTIFELADKEIVVRKSSSYYQSLLSLNKTLQAVGKKPVRIIFASQYLEDEDLLELVNAGLIPFMVIDNHKGEFWAKIYPKITLHPGVKLRQGGKIAWAIRKKSPLLKKNINQFVKTIKKGTLTGNLLFQRYLGNTGYIGNVLSENASKRYRQTIALFKKYGAKYDFPYLLLTALAYQESGLDQQKRSQAGAIGIMQILPSTARDKHVHVKNIDHLENNILAGVRYLRFMKDRYFADPKLTPLNQDLFTIASYNAGPAKITKIRDQAARRGYDPDIWFNNVEVAAAAMIGRETVQYVRNIYKYYIVYEYIEKKQALKKAGIATLESHYEK